MLVSTVLKLNNVIKRLFVEVCYFVFTIFILFSRYLKYITPKK